MFKNLSAALIAASLIAGPALAQGNAPTTAPATTTPAKIVKHDATAKVKKSKRHVSHAVKHRKHIAHVKHVKKIKHVRVHGKHVAKHTAKNGKSVRVN